MPDFEKERHDRLRKKVQELKKELVSMGVDLRIFNQEELPRLAVGARYAPSDQEDDGYAD